MILCVYSCVCVCMHACVFVCLCVCLCVWMYVCVTVCKRLVQRKLHWSNCGKEWKKNSSPLNFLFPFRWNVNFFLCNFKFSSSSSSWRQKWRKNIFLLDSNLLTKKRFFFKSERRVRKQNKQKYGKKFFFHCVFLIGSPVVFLLLLGIRWKRKT